MRLDLDKQQYLNLVKLACFGNEVANGLRDDDERISKFDQTVSWLLEQAERFGCAKCAVECRCPLGPHFAPSEKLLEDPDFQLCIEDYEDELFWVSLEERLADRDLRRQHGVRRIARMSTEELETRLEPLIDRYARETERHGVDRLEIKE